MGSAPRTRIWPSGKQPTLQVRVDGQWRRAAVLQRQDWPDGRVAYLMDVWLPDGFRPDSTSAMVRTYWWDPAAMRRD